MRQKLFFVDTSVPVNEFLRNYEKNFGTIKYSKEKEKSETSKRILKFLEAYKQKPVPVNGDDFFTLTTNDPSYLFAKRETIAVAALLLLNKWDYEINQEIQLFSFADIEQMDDRIFDLSLNKLKI